ncbi:MAG: spore germination protein [Clostridia bacterium]|nr:spore germination protein [Clostridia bacterium]
MSLLENVTPAPREVRRLSASLTENAVALAALFSGCFDFKTRRTLLSGARIEARFFFLDGMCDNTEIFMSVTEPILSSRVLPEDPGELYEAVRDGVSVSVQQTELFTLNEAKDALLSGNLLFFIDGEERALCFGVQGYPKKSVEEPQTDMQEQGSREGFTDSFKDNAALVRRRLKTADLRLEHIVLGTGCKTDALVCYMDGRADAELLYSVKERLAGMKIDYISGEGCVEPFLAGKGLRVFRTVGFTERPDVFCAKLTEGKVGVIVDGTPHALTAPFTLIEYFATLDDYQKRPFYALFLRCIRVLSFLCGIFLPGVYVAAAVYHPEMIPAGMLYNIVSSVVGTPFPVMAEALLVHIVYEVVREAGLRMPRAVGQAVSIVGALIIGDAAVTAGLISAPMLIIMALTAITSAVISDLHDPICVLRLAFILAGGTAGLYGVALGAGVLLLNICAQEPFGVPFTLPMLPFRKEGMRDALLRRDWRKMGKKRFVVKF